jgi:glycosyltransferase involved in cell wall biosynthesis
MISVAIITKNEEKNILDCLESALWADEIIIVDDNSDDRTIEVIKNLSNKKIKIYSKALDGDFASQRNYALSKATKKWVLFLDADERITNELREEINAFLIENVKSSNLNGFFIKRKDFMWGKELNHGETGGIKLLRFSKKDSGIWKGKVHEVWEVEGNISEMENNLIHFPHQTIDEFLSEINFYTSLRAKELYENKIQGSVKNIILYPKGKFIKNYFIKLGFLDGIEGFLFAIFMSLHSFLVRGKLWLLWKRR